MTGRSDYGSRPWRHPALLSYGQPDSLRRGSQQDVLVALRHLLTRPSEASSHSPEAAPLGFRRPGEVSCE